MIDNKTKEILLKIEDIYYENGSDGGDFMNLGEIIISYAEKEYGRLAYQEFQNWLNHNLTVHGSNVLFNDIVANNLMEIYLKHYQDCSNLCHETIILKEFKSIVELIQIALESLKNQKETELSDLINITITKRLNNNVQEKLNITSDIDSIRSFIKDQIFKQLNLNFKTAAQLTRIVSTTIPKINDYIADYTMEFIYLRDQPRLQQ